MKSSAKYILVTGGAGYIGSNTVNLLIKRKFKVIIVDNLSTGNKKLIHPEAIFYKIDLLNLKKLETVFKKYKIDTVVHFAAFSQVEESSKKPAKYLNNNIFGGLNLLKVMAKFNCKKIIFSSSSAVYGIPESVPITERHAVNPISVYGETKAVFEKILENYHKKSGLKYLSLRYFNAGGSSDDGKYGEMHNPESHLIPTILKNIKDNKKVFIFGNNYPTKDGTCVRDYVHVEDIALAHIYGINYLNKSANKSEIINLGTGKGFSVKEIINLCGKLLKKKIIVKIGPKRTGDPAVLVAGYKKAQKLLNWKPRKSISDIIFSAWKFQDKIW